MFTKFFFYQYFLIDKVIKNAKPKTSTIVAPEARLKMYESSKPTKFNVAPIIIEKNITFLISYVNCMLIAAGMLKRAIIRITPTTLIRTTTLKATRDKKK